MRRRLEALERQSRENPEDVGPVIRYAVALDRAGDWRAALDQWERVLELDESCGLAWARSARGLARHGAIHDALEAFQVGLALNALAPEGLVTKGLKALRENSLHQLCRQSVEMHLRRGLYGGLLPCAVWEQTHPPRPRFSGSASRGRA